MRKFLTHAGAFLAGALIAGAAVMALWVSLLDEIVEADLDQLSYEQHALAQRATREGDVFAEIVHTAQHAFLEDRIGLAWADRMHTAPWFERAKYPWIWKETQPSKEVQQTLRMTGYTRLAWVLEQRGMEAEAAPYWELAKSLDPKHRSDETLRVLGSWLAEPISCAQHIESALLDARTYAELNEMVEAGEERFVAECSQHTP